MQPDQPEQLQQPQSVPEPLIQPIATPTPVVNNHKRTILALWLLIGPTALIVVSILLYALVNFLTSSDSSSSDALFGEPNPIRTAANIFLFLVGAIATLTWLPGIITGIILLATKKR